MCKISKLVGQHRIAELLIKPVGGRAPRDDGEQTMVNHWIAESTDLPLLFGGKHPFVVVVVVVVVVVMPVSPSRRRRPHFCRGAEPQLPKLFLSPHLGHMGSTRIDESALLVDTQSRKHQ